MAEITEILCDSEAATTALAVRLADVLRPGDVILLEGPVGAGKSVFARALIQARLAAAGRPAEDIPSPTFTLVQSYDALRPAILHADLYRLTSDDELEEIGLLGAGDDTVLIVEWPERLPVWLKHAALRLAIRLEGGARRLTFVAETAGWAPRLAEAGIGE